MRYLHATTQILADAQTTVYFCMNFPAKLQRRITDSVRSMEALAKNPLFMDTLIIDEVIAFYRDVIKSFRTRMIALVCDLFFVPFFFCAIVCPATLLDVVPTTTYFCVHTGVVITLFMFPHMIYVLVMLTMQPQNDDTSRSTETSIKLEELATTWCAILRDIHATISHIHHLQDLAQARPSKSSSSSSSSSSSFPMSQFQFQDVGGAGDGAHGYSHTRQKSSEVFGPRALEVLELQHSTCEFWARCVSM
jgi:hypothetical protein